MGEVLLSSKSFIDIRALGELYSNCYVLATNKARGTLAQLAQLPNATLLLRRKLDQKLQQNNGACLMLFEVSLSFPQPFSKSWPSARTLVIGALFLPAALGLLGQAIWALGLTGSGRAKGAVAVLAIATFLICLEQARMAAVDLWQIEAVRPQRQDSQLNRFSLVTRSTIAIELVGFYVAVLWVGWGALIVLLSQLWFNLLAEIQLQPAAPAPVQPRRWADRLSVLAADGVGLGLVSLWIAGVAPLYNAALLLGIVLVYGWVKYLQPQLKSPH